MQVPKLTPLSDVDFLITRKLGDIERREPEDRIFAPGTEPARDTIVAAIRKHNEKVREYRAELEAMPTDQRDALVQQQREALRQEEQTKAEKIEQERPFNRPHALATQAIYDFASKCAHWTIDEAIAYSLGRNPKAVFPSAVEFAMKANPLVPSPFKERYDEIRELAKRAIQWKLLYDPVLPGIFLAWAKRTGIDVPADLLAAVQARGTQVADWKTLHDNAQKVIETLSATNETLSQTNEIRKNSRQQAQSALNVANERQASMQAEIDRLSALVDQQEAPSKEPRQSSVQQRLNKAHRIMLGMAVAEFGYQIGKDKQACTGPGQDGIHARIRSHLTKTMPNVGTILDHLQEASQAYLDEEK